MNKSVNLLTIVISCGLTALLSLLLISWDVATAKTSDDQPSSTIPTATPRVVPTLTPGQTIPIERIETLEEQVGTLEKQVEALDKRGAFVLAGNILTLALVVAVSFGMNAYLHRQLRFNVGKLGPDLSFDARLTAAERGLQQVRARISGSDVEDKNQTSPSMIELKQQIQRLEADLDSVERDIRVLKHKTEQQIPSELSQTAETGLSQVEEPELQLLIRAYDECRQGGKYAPVTALVKSLIDTQAVASTEEALAMIDHLARRYPQAIRMGRVREKQGNQLTIFKDRLSEGKQ